MKKEIVCQFHLFDLHQNIMLIDGDDAQVVCISSLNQLGADLAKMCEKFDVNDVHIYGSNSYAEKIVEQLVRENVANYANRPINVEIN